MRRFLTIAALAGAMQPLGAQATGPAPAAVDTLWRATAATAIPITRRLAGNPADAGPFRYSYQAPAGASLAAHRHSADMRITVRSGRKM